MKTLDWAFIKLLYDIEIPIIGGDKIALIGEETRYKEYSCLFRSLKKRFPEIDTRDVHLFTNRRSFTGDVANSFDWLLSVRTCSMGRTRGPEIGLQETYIPEEDLLDIAQKHDKRLFMVPCLCHPAEEKLVRYSRKYSCIRGIYSIFVKDTEAGLVSKRGKCWNVIVT